MTVQKYIDHVDQCFKNALKGESKCSQEILDMEGMTGKYTRAFYNNLLALDDARYLEVGAWKGSSICSALFGNKATATVIDNWSEFGGPKEECIHNISHIVGQNDVTICDADSFSINFSKIPGPYNIYLYDGCHKRESHEMALTFYQNVLDDVFIFVCDDWNWRHVREGTYDAIKKLGLFVEYARSQYTKDNEMKESWWNGICALVLRKNK